MNVLALNAGSSSLKFKLMSDNEIIADGLLEKIGGLATVNLNVAGVAIKKEETLENHYQAILYLISLLNKHQLDKFDAIGHRVVHGGDKYFQAVAINKKVLADIDRFSQLAPLHNPINLKVIKICRKLFPKTKMIAVFDTAFHQTMPKEEYTYAIPWQWQVKHQIRKYGFHGISHQYLSSKITKETKARKIITCHLGNGCSISAIKDGKCLATSMGFTPNAGLMMGTRSGDIDAMIIPYLLNYYSLEEINQKLNFESGLQGLSEVSNDFRLIEKNLDQENCQLAFNKFVRMIVKYIAEYYVLLDDVEAIVFAGGIGTNSKLLREKVLEKLKVFDIIIDKKANQENQFLITKENSKIKGYVLKTDEELMIIETIKEMI